LEAIISDEFQSQLNKQAKVYPIIFDIRKIRALKIIGYISASISQIQEYFLLTRMEKNK
jgi:hypothetical protein